MIPDPRERPTISVVEAGRFLGMGRSKSYEEANRFLVTHGAEGLPVIRFGRTLRVPTARLLAEMDLQNAANRGPGDG